MSSFNDIQPPKLRLQLGALHPINQGQRFLIDLLQGYGFTAVDGPEIESEEFNFDMLNIKKHTQLGKCMIPFMLIIKLKSLEHILHLFKLEVCLIQNHP
jgi:hypothetical protein